MKHDFGQAAAQLRLVSMIATALLGLWIAASPATASGDARLQTPGGDASKASGSTMTMSQQASGETDRDFAVNMRDHHKMALDMAQKEIATGKDPKMVSMARKIIAAQKKEIAEFDKWLASHGGVGGAAHKSK